MRRVTIGYMALVLTAAGCSDPSAPDASGARLEMNLAGELHADVGGIDLEVAYRRSAGDARLLLGTRLTAGSQDETLTVRIDLAPCLQDPDRVGGADECTVDLTLTLLGRDDGILDEQVVGPLVLRNGRTTTAPPVRFTILTLTVTPTTALVEVGQVVQLEARVIDTAGNPVTGHPIDWLSEDSTVASVDQAGRVTGVRVGTAAVHAVSGRRRGTATVTVEPAAPTPVASVDVTPASSFVTVGATRQLTATLRDAAGNVLTGLPVTWESSDAAVATVSQTGLVSGIAVGGPVNITATSEGRSGTANVTVTPTQPPGFLQCGGLVGDSIVAAAQVNVHPFNGSAGDDVLLTLAGSGGWAGTNRPRATVVAPDGSGVGTFDGNGQFRTVLPQTGGYSVRISAHNLTGTGTYNLGLECMRPLGPVEAHLTSGDLQAGEIAAPGQVDLFTFHAGANDDVLLTLAGTSGWPGTSRPRATVLGPNGDVLGTFDGNSQSRLVLPGTGTYIIYVRSHTLTGAGGYNLGLESIRPLGPTQGHLSSGDLHAGQIAAPGQVDLVTFAGSAGDNILLTLAGTSGWPGTNRARATILAPSGQALATFDANGQVEAELTETGTFVVYVRAHNLVGTGGYNLGLTVQ